MIQLFYLSLRNKEVIISEYLSSHLFCFVFSFPLLLEQKCCRLPFLSLYMCGFFLAVIVPQKAEMKTDFTVSSDSPYSMFILSCMICATSSSLRLQLWRVVYAKMTIPTIHKPMSELISFTYCIINTTEKYCLYASLKRCKSHWDCWAKVVTHK